MSEARPPLPPFTEQTAIQKIRAAEDAWNTRDPERVSLAYTVDSQWRNRSEIFQGLWSWLKGSQLANLVCPTLQAVAEQAELGIERARRTPHLAYAFLRRTGLSVS